VINGVLTEETQDLIGVTSAKRLAEVKDGFDILRHQPLPLFLLRPGRHSVYHPEQICVHPRMIGAHLR
jgi:hypothetical protein